MCREGNSLLGHWKPGKVLSFRFRPSASLLFSFLFLFSSYLILSPLVPWKRRDKIIEEIINQLMIAAVVFAGAEINCCNDDEAEERIKEQEKSPWNLECFF